MTRINSVMPAYSQPLTFKGKEKQGRNTAPAVASAFIPGLGQMMNGETKEGVFRLLGEFGLGIALGTLAVLLKANKTVSAICTTVIWLTIAALRLNGIVDAYRYKSKEE